MNRTPAQLKKLHTDWEKSELPISQFCRKKGIPPHVLYNYRDTLKRKAIIQEYKASNKTTAPSKVEALAKARTEVKDLQTKEGALIAPDFLTKAATHLQDRAVTHDKPEGERSIAKTVEMFNALTDSNMTEEQGWKFMVLLKLVRSEQGNFNADNFEDGAAYMALAGEAASKNQKIVYQIGNMPS